jgi:hypothetical protein
MVPDGGPLPRPIFRPLPASRAVRNSHRLGGGQRQVRADRVDETTLTPGNNSPSGMSWDPSNVDRGAIDHARAGTTSETWYKRTKCGLGDQRLGPLP